MGCVHVHNGANGYEAVAPVVQKRRGMAVGNRREKACAVLDERTMWWIDTAAEWGQMIRARWTCMVLEEEN